MDPEGRPRDSKALIGFMRLYETVQVLELQVSKRPFISPCALRGLPGNPSSCSAGRVDSVKPYVAGPKLLIQSSKIRTRETFIIFQSDRTHIHTFSLVSRHLRHSWQILEMCLI